MENINNYLFILTGLIAFFVIIIIYLKFNYQRFTEITERLTPATKMTSMSPIGVLNNYKRPEHYLYSGCDTNIQKYDSRYQFSDLPPVNPVVGATMIQSVLPVEHDLYSTQGYIAPYTELDPSPPGPTNQLDYSGGVGKMINIPLQFNAPYDEQLRTQPILITDYNKIKYQ